MKNSPHKPLRSLTLSGAAILVVGLVALGYIALIGAGVARDVLYFGGLGLSFVGILFVGFGLLVRSTNRAARS